MPYADPVRLKQYKLDWARKKRASDPAAAREKRHQQWLSYKARYSERIKEQKKRMWRKHKTAELSGYKRRLREYRRRVIEHYSNGTLKCECCGESIYEFLTINHINGGGSKERREVGAQNLPRLLINRGFPPGYNILCYNSNCGMRTNKVCPHKATC